MQQHPEMEIESVLQKAGQNVMLIKVIVQGLETLPCEGSFKPCTPGTRVSSLPQLWSFLISSGVRHPQGFPGGSDGKESACSAGDLGLILENGCLSTPVFLPGEFQDRGAWWAKLHEIVKSWEQLSR